MQTPVQDYIFDTMKTLPHEAIKLTVTRGDAWVFTDCGDFILHAGEACYLSERANPVVVRRAYTRGFAKVQIEVVA